MLRTFTLRYLYKFGGIIILIIIIIMIIMIINNGIIVIVKRWRLRGSSRVLIEWIPLLLDGKSIPGCCWPDIVC